MTERPPDTGIPRWVKLAAIIVIILALLVAAMMLATGGHSPRPHGASPGLVTLGVQLLAMPVL